MFKENSNRWELILALAVLGVLVAYSYAYLFVMPYSGFQFGSDGEVVDVFVSQPGGEALQIGDSLVRVGEIEWEEYAQDASKQFFEGRAPGDEIEIVFERAGEELVVDWVFPGFTQTELRSRLINTWVLSFAFWVAGAATLLLVRPKDKRWALLVALNFITALWLIAGVISQGHVWGSYQLLRSAIWVSLPIYLHFHWNFPNELADMPKGFWWGLYAISGLGAALQGLGILPGSYYIWPFALAIIGSACLTVVHFVLKPRQRRQILLLFFALSMALLPALIIGLASSQTAVASESRYLSGFLLSLIFLPFGYFYVLYQGNPEQGELRANRLITLYLLLMLLLTAFFVFLPNLSQLLMSPENVGLVVFMVLIIVSISVLGFNNFERFVERRILRMPLPPEGLLQSYADHISTSLTSENLSFVLRDEVLPSLLVRQSHLYQRNDTFGWEQLFSLGEPSEALASETLDKLSDSASVDPAGASAQWIRLSLPLIVAGEKVGLWLLGRKDPDDAYSAAEISVLKAMADQTAIALINISQARRLRAMYRANIERTESERADLARELHDEVLGGLAELALKVGDESYTSEFESDYHQLNDRIRSAIQGLRSPMLSFGLYKAVQALKDELGMRTEGVDLQIDVSGDEEFRFPLQVEQHLYRIVQQACENSLRHAGASQVLVSGAISDRTVNIRVEDDGQGFALDEDAGLVSLLRDRHYGLAGMHERADLIGAELQIKSRPGEGTTVAVSWEQKN